MRTAHLLSDDLFNQAMEELQAGNHIVVYNAAEYLLDKGDMYFFKDEGQAKDFVIDNSNDRDHFQTIKASSLMDIYDHFMIEHSLQLHPAISSHLKNKIMEENNYEYLAKQIKFTGFGEGDQEELKRKMQEGKPNFLIQHESTYGKDTAITRMDFKKSDEKDMYFFNSFTMNLKHFGQESPVEQKFYINNKQDNVTLKEAYNMLSGRAVEKEITPKEGEKFKAWVQLDFKETDTNGQYKTKQFHPNYGFDLEKVLDRHPLKELETPEGKKQLMESLQRGNRQSVTLEAEGKSIKLFIEAAPQFKSLNYYDSNMKRMQSHEVSAAVTVKQTNGIEQKQDGKTASVKQNAGGGDDDIDGGKKQRRTRRQSV